MTLKNGAATLGVGSLSSAGIAILITSTLPVGTYNITAVYAGNIHYHGSTSASDPLAVSKTGTTTLVGSAPNPSKVGQLVTFTAQVIPAVGSTAGLFGQKVTFKNGAAILGIGTINSFGLATLTTSALAAGSHSITVVYAGNTNYVGSTSTVLTHVVVNTVSVALISSANPAPPHSLVTFTAIVRGSGPVPTGTVTFYVDGVAQTTVSLSSGRAIFRTSTLALGRHTILVVYSGDGSHPSAQAAIIQTVSSIGRRV